jgi:hypothetical protein
MANRGFIYDSVGRAPARQMRRSTDLEAMTSGSLKRARRSEHADTGAPLSPADQD